jgi:hypothetical protein
LARLAQVKWHKGAARSGGPRVFADGSPTRCAGAGEREHGSDLSRQDCAAVYDTWDQSHDWITRWLGDHAEWTCQQAADGEGGAHVPARDGVEEVVDRAEAWELEAGAQRPVGVDVDIGRRGERGVWSSSS